MLVKNMRRWSLMLLAAMALTMAAQVARAADPDKVNIAIILSAGIENGWDGSLIRSLERVKEERPHGLDVTWKYTDPLWGDQAGEAMRLFAQTGQYDIIWAHSTYSDQVRQIKDEFPDILFVVVGSGNEGLGGNQYWVYKRVHEAAYLMGIIAGSMTKSNTLGVVGTFPADDVNDEINGFFAGARSVNPDVRQKVAFIESWYDPVKAAEYTHAQIAAGADFIFQLAANFEPCEQRKIMCFGNFQDENHLSPESIVSSAMARWDPDVKWVIDEWWQHRTAGTPYKGNTTNNWFTMAEGGAGLAPYHRFDEILPAEVKARVAEAKAGILSGARSVPLDVSIPRSK